MKSRILIICLSLLSINCAMASNPPSEWIHGDSLILPETKTSLGISEYQGLSSKIRVIVFSENFTSFGTSCLQGGKFTTFVFKSATPPSQGTSMRVADTIKCPCEAYDAYANASGWRDDTGWGQKKLLRDLPYTLNAIESTQGSVTKEYPCDGSIIITAVPNHGYHFTQWSDGKSNNPRTVVMTQDTTFAAEYAKNTYTITTESNNSEWGTTFGDKSALYLDEVEISATANYGYHFVRWNDGNTQNPRIVTVTDNTTYQAIFAKNTYSITKNAEHGNISGNSYAEYLDEVTLTVNADYGYHFTHWSDGETSNPRVFVITHDTTFTAEFAVDKSGKCGDNLALTWTYDGKEKALTISGSGTLNGNYTFGVEAPTLAEKLIIAEGVTTIGKNAFSGYTTLKHLSMAASVKTIHERAFYNCTGLQEIYSYREKPSNAYSDTFDGIDKSECTLHVLSSAAELYSKATGWRDFYLVEAIDAEKVTEEITDVKVEPTDNAAEVTWPIKEQAATYTLVISKDGVVFCTLIFNANGQLQGIAFAPSKNGNRHAPAAVKTSNGGLRFTVTGLDSGTNYHLTLNAKDSGDQVIATYVSNFATSGVSTGIEDVKQDIQVQKIMREGQIYILRGDKTYTLQGQEVK